MADICSKCGLPKDICVCSTISKEQQKIKVHRELRKWRKPVTVIEGIEDKNIDLVKLCQKLKALCACGGTTKRNQIILQGDHRDKTEQLLVKLGFQKVNIEIS